jgi:hypothetical protein
MGVGVADAEGFGFFGANIEEILFASVVCSGARGPCAVATSAAPTANTAESPQTLNRGMDSPSSRSRAGGSPPSRSGACVNGDCSRGVRGLCQRASEM